MGEHPLSRWVAWITTDPTCVLGDYADVTVRREELSDVTDQGPVYKDAGDHEMYPWRGELAELAGVEVDQDMRAEADTWLSVYGWTRVGEWREVPTGAVAVLAAR